MIYFSIVNNGHISNISYQTMLKYQCQSIDLNIRLSCLHRESFQLHQNYDLLVVLQFCHRYISNRVIRPEPHSVRFANLVYIY